MEIQYRKLRPEESAANRIIRLECLKNYPVNFGSDYQIEKGKEKLFFQPHIEIRNPKIFMVGAFFDGRLIAISGFCRYDTLKTKHRGRIIQVYVKPEFQGRNIGFSIIENTLEKAFRLNEMEQVEIDVLTTNTTAERLYRKLGFNEYGIQKNYLKIGNEYLDHKMMVIFKEEFLQNKI